jgi:hypothetical protein
MNTVHPEPVAAASGPSPKVVLAGGVGSGALMLLLSAGIVIWTLSRPQPAPLLASNNNLEQNGVEQNSVAQVEQEQPKPGSIEQVTPKPEIEPESPRASPVETTNAEPQPGENGNSNVATANPSQPAAVTPEPMPPTPLTPLGRPPVVPTTPVASGPPPEKLELKVAKPVDLIRQIGPTRRVGDYSLQDGILTTGDMGLTKVEFLYRLPDNYVVEARLARVSKLESIGLSIRVGGRPCAVILDGWPFAGDKIEQSRAPEFRDGPFSGLDMIDGLRVPQNPTRAVGRQLENGKSRDLRIIVVGNRVIAQLDGKTLFDWTGDPARLSESGFTRFNQNSHHFGITTQSASYRIEKLLVYRVTDSGTPLPENVAGNGNGNGNPMLAGGNGDPMPEAPPAAPLAKAAVPEEAAQKPVRDNLSTIFGEQIAKAKKPEDRAQLARELNDVAKSEKDLTTRFVLLRAARKMAVAGHDFSLALEIADQVFQQFEVDRFAERLDVLEEAATAAGSLTGPQKSLAELAATMAAEALEIERFDLAEEASKIAYESALKSKDADQRRETKALRDEIVAEKKLWDGMQAALETLKTNPADAASELIVGKYYALARDDWAKALPHLAASSDPALAAAAKLELAATDSKGQLTAADAWYDGVAGAAAGEKLTLQKHALELYEGAAPQLTGLDQIKAGKRRDELKALVDKSEQSAPAVAASAKTKRKPRFAALEPGLIARTYRGEPFRRPTQVISLVTSSDEYFNDAIEEIRKNVGYYSPEYLQPMAGGYIVLEQAGAVQFELMNCIVLLNGAPLAEANRGDVVTFEKKLAKGRYPVLFYRATQNISSGPLFRVKLSGEDKNILFHSPDELKIELAKPVTNNNVTATGVLVYTTKTK